MISAILLLSCLQQHVPAEVDFKWNVLIIVHLKKQSGFKHVLGNIDWDTWPTLVGPLLEPCFPFGNRLYFPFSQAQVSNQEQHKSMERETYVWFVSTKCVFESWTLITLHWDFDASLHPFSGCLWHFKIFFLLLQAWHKQTWFRFIQKMKYLRSAAMSPFGVMWQRDNISPECTQKTWVSPIIRPAWSAARHMPSLSSQTKRRGMAVLSCSVLQWRSLI